MINLMHDIRKISDSRLFLTKCKIHYKLLGIFCIKSSHTIEIGIWENAVFRNFNCSVKAVCIFVNLFLYRL